MRIHYRFFNNSQLTPEGHLSGMMNGWKHGDQLTLAYEGVLETNGYPHALNDKTRAKLICNDLFEIFNISRPAAYRGPSMSVGDVVQLVDTNLAFAVERIGFREAQIQGAPMGVRNPKWGKFSDFAA